MPPPNKAMSKRSSAGSMSAHVLLDLGDLGESSSDSDFRIEDHDNESDFSDDNSNDDRTDNDDGDSSEDNNGDDDSDDDFSMFKDSLNSTSGKEKKSSKIRDDVVVAADAPTLSVKQLLQQAKAKEAIDRANAKLLATPICCACLGDRSDDTNEIVECDNCGISVHEGCYGISDSGSVSSTVSSCSTEPWFCEACKANVDEPVCELCPNRGGIFKETDVGKWVHLVCALYVPGVAFGEVDHLSSVTLFEMPYSKWGAKSCSLCEDVRFARTGVCIGCDAGMCKTYFHVTCAQAAGLLSEAHSEEADHADPFYAHCKIHSDKTLIKHRKRNFNGLRLKMNFRLQEHENKRLEKPSTEQQRIERKLKKHRTKYVSNKAIKSEPWVPTQKMPRLLTTSASACRKLILKSELMGIDTAALEFQEAQMAALSDIRKKWHIPPAFSVEFIGYYLDRISRLKEIKVSLHDQLELNKRLVDEQQLLRDQYDQHIKSLADHTEANAALKATIEKLHAAIYDLCPNKSMPSIETIGRPIVTVPEPLPPVAPPPPQARPMSVPTAAALKMGVGFPLTNLPGTNEDPNRILSTQCQNNSKLMHDCGYCKRRNDQHMLAKCDTCHLHYHLGCLNPPLTRHPKKSKLYGWQCSECVKSDDSDAAVTLPAGPRKSRTKFHKDGSIVPVDPPQSDEFSACETTHFAAAVSIDLCDDDVKPEVFVPNRPVVNVPPSPVSPSKKTGAEKRVAAPAAIEKIEEVLLVPVDNDNAAHSARSIKRKKVKKSATVAADNGPAAEHCLAVADADDDPLDISNSSIIIIPKVPSLMNEQPNAATVNNISTSTNAAADAFNMAAPPKVKRNKKTKKDKTAFGFGSDGTGAAIKAPEYYIDQNGVLNAIRFDKDEPYTSEVIPGSTSGATSTSSTMAADQAEQQMLALHKQNRKRRKEKHRNKHANDHDHADRSPGKEHKKKRKKKNHDMENPANSSSSNNLNTTSSSAIVGTEGIPRIKIKFKTLSLPGEPAAEPHFFYVSADVVRPNKSIEPDRSAAVVVNNSNTSSSSSHNAISTANKAATTTTTITNNNSSSNTITPIKPSAPLKAKPIAATTAVVAAPVSTPPATSKPAKPSPAAPKLAPIRARRLSVINSRMYTAASAAIVNTTTTTTTNQSNNTSSSTSPGSSKCDVCSASGTNQDTVRCDECKKNYHFQCLEPPVKKTPKRRGYSWHCADCDPTDVESN